MNELERLEMQRKEINKKIQQLKRQNQTINGSVYLEKCHSGKLNIRVKKRDFYLPDENYSAFCILSSFDPRDLVKAINDVIDDLKIIQRSLAEEEGKG